MSEPIERRKFLNNSWRWGTGLVVAAGAWTSWDLLQPPPTSGFGGQVRAVPPDAVPSDGVLPVPAARAYLTRVDDEVIALYWKCTHLGCRVPWCESSGQFECPCHGSIFNRAGEYRAGPAPRGMDRFNVNEVDGILEVDTSNVVEGPDTDQETLDEPARGPSCAGGDH